MVAPRAGGRGLKSPFVRFLWHYVSRPPRRGALIEIRQYVEEYHSYNVAPRAGGRGLKFRLIDALQNALLMSPPAQGGVD